VVPTPPGGPNDLVARVVGGQLSERWKRAVVVESRPGGGTMIAARYVARAVPDGHTLVLLGNSVMTAGLFMKEPGIEPQELEQVGQVAWGAYVLVTNPQLPVKTLQEFIAYAKANPEGVAFSSIASTVFDLDYAILQQATGTRMRNIPYQGVSPGMQAVLRNESQLLLGVSGVVGPQIEAGKLVPIAVASRVRISRFPGVPTATEQGVNYTAGFDFGLQLPAATPRDILQELRMDLAEELKKPGLARKIRDLGLEPATITPEEWIQLMRRDAQTYAETAKRIGLQPQ
jgi:tripartite-type tricarboxylate transporter receptor subunit TctC